MDKSFLRMETSNSAQITKIQSQKCSLNCAGSSILPHCYLQMIFVVSLSPLKLKCPMKTQIFDSVICLCCCTQTAAAQTVELTGFWADNSSGSSRGVSSSAAAFTVSLLFFRRTLTAHLETPACSRSLPIRPCWVLFCAGNKAAEEYHSKHFWQQHNVLCYFFHRYDYCYFCKYHLQF